MDWKEEFLKLFISEDVNDYGRALDLKRKNIPEKLYRYRPLKKEDVKFRFGEIVRGELFLSHSKDLNDPFEVCSVLQSLSPAAYLDKKIYMKSFKELMEPHDYERIFGKEAYWEDFIDYVARKTMPEERAVETKAALEKVFMGGIEDITRYINEQSRKMVRFASFSETFNNLPMWHHYADGHTGICLEYTTNEISEIYHLNMMFPVYYVEKLPDIACDMFRKKHPKFGLFKFQAMHKLQNWNYEKEWRLIHDAGSWYTSLEKVPKNFWTSGKPIQFIRPSKVILGKDITAENECEMRKAADLVNIPVVKAEITPYGLKVD